MFLAIDQGTTGTTAVVLDRELNLLAKANREFQQLYPEPGWVEHRPQAIWASVRDAVRAVLADQDVRVAEIQAIGITNQRETSVIWDRESHEPIHNAIVWQCRRTADTCDALKAAGNAVMVRKKTGLVLDPYFSGTKAAWMLDHVDGARERAERGELAFGTIDSFLVWQLTAGDVHVTDVSNASRTMLMDLRSGEWDDGLCSMLRVPRVLLPEIRGNAEVYGHTKGLDFLPDGIPIAGMAGDQQAALFGQACFEPGEAKCTYGTGAFLLMNTGAEVVESTHGLLSTAAWRVGGKTTYALEGSAFVAGAVVQWLRDEMKFFESAEEVESLAATVDDSGGVVLVPAFTGLGAPHWNPHARGVLWGITRGTKRAHVARAALEGIAFQNTEILQAMQADLGEPMRALKVDGGASANDLLMQFQADLLNVPLSRPHMLETTALGAALLAALGVGAFDDVSAIRDAWLEQRRFTPAMSDAERAKALSLWQKGIARV
ncbi:MAG: glycerol kinase [Bradymonadia bacterium]|jgi:glycerol kinase